MDSLLSGRVCPSVHMFYLGLPVLTTHKVTDYGLDDLGSISGWGQDYILCHHVQAFWNPPSLLLSSWYSEIFTGLTRLAGAANYSHPSSTEGKNEWSFPVLLLYTFMLRCAMKSLVLRSPLGHLWSATDCELCYLPYATIATAHLWIRILKYSHLHLEALPVFMSTMSSHTESFHSILLTTNIMTIIMSIKSRRIRWAKHVASMRRGDSHFQFCRKNLKGVDHLEDVWVRGVIIKFPECPHICSIE
jgi:hypothetical protein